MDKENAYPEVGYQTAEWDMLKPPSERLMPLTHTHKLKLSDMSVRSDGEMTQYSLFDSHGNTYTQDQFDEIPDSPDIENLSDTLGKIESTEGQEKRLALAHLAKIVETNPTESTEVVSVLTKYIGNAEPAVQGEALGILETISSEQPEVVLSAVESSLNLLEESVHPLLRNEALAFLAVATEQHTEPVVDVVPRLAELLQDSSTDVVSLSKIFIYIARHDPDSLIPVTTKLELYLETEPGKAHVGILAALGYLSKTHPTMGKELIPIAIELLNTNSPTLRANSLGLLADLSDEYPTELKAILPQVTELLEDEDGKTRANATSILARVANKHPEEVEPATDQLISALDDEMVDARFNACWALNYMESEEALDKLYEVTTQDSDEEVRTVAHQAIDSIES